MSFQTLSDNDRNEKWAITEYNNREPDDKNSLQYISNSMCKWRNAF